MSADQPHTLPPGITLRPWRSDDIAEVARLDVEIFGPASWSRKMYDDEFANAQRYYLIAEAQPADVGPGGRPHIAAWAGIALGEESHLMTIAVQEHYRRRGIASALVQALIAHAATTPTRAMILEVRETDRGAQELYFRFGFRNIGVRKNYFPGTWEDAIVMKRDFPLEPN